MFYELIALPYDVLMECIVLFSRDFAVKLDMYWMLNNYTFWMAQNHPKMTSLYKPNYMYLMFPDVLKKHNLAMFNYLEWSKARARNNAENEWVQRQVARGVRYF